MKIALVSPYDYSYPGGVAIHIHNLHEQFTAMGHYVRIIAPYSGSRSDLDRRNIIPIGRPIPIHSGGSVARITLSPLLSAPLKAVLESEGFDVVHIHEPLVSTITLATLGVSSCINVGTFHACHTSSRGYRLLGPLLKRWFNRLHGRIAVSRPAQDFIGKYFPADYTIIPNGIDVASFSAEASPIEEFRDGKLNILFVGRIEKRKGLKYLLGAFKTVKRELPRSRLIVVGPGDTSKQKMMARLTGLEDVVFTGFVSNEDLHRYYQTADVFCSPATGGESFGIILLEAMAASKPIVASSIDGYASVMTPGAEGLMVPPRDEAALAEALIQLLKNEELRREMGARGRQTAETYSWPNVARRVNEYYETLCNRS